MHCQNSTLSDETAARVLGWRVWSGTTMGGKQKRDVVCPVCAGTGEPEPEPGPSWDVMCTTCGWQYTDEGPILAGEELANARDAESAAYDHECEQAFRFKSPDGKWYDENTKEFTDLVVAVKR